MQDLPPSYIETKPRRGMTCFAKGCVTVAAIFALFFIALWGCGIYFQRTFGSFVSDHPVSIHENTTTNEQYQVALRKLQPLTGLETPGQTAAPIEITADDLNALVAHDPRLADARGKYFFTIPGNQLAVDISTETPQQSGSSARTYYVNARVIGGVEISDGSIRLAPRKIESLSGKEFPGWIMSNRVFAAMIDSFNKDLNKNIRNNTDLADMVAKISASKIENNHLVLTVTEAAGTPAAGASPVAAPTP